MKFNVIAVTHAVGVSKTGSAFSIPRAVVLNRVEVVSGAKYSQSGAGFTPQEFDVADDFIVSFLTKFTADFKGVAVVYDLDVLPRERGNAVVLGFSGSAPVQPRASTNP